MYRYKPKEIKYPKLKRFLSLILIVFCACLITVLLHNMYLGIEISPFGIENEANEANLNLTRTLEQSKVSSKELADVIEEVSSSVVGISKIKNNGNSIFLNDSTSSLGLGTGIIVTDNGYILTNEHVAGSKYSTCYVTLENGKNYSGNVVWADTDIDLAIVKINVKSLPYCKLGDSSNIRVGESVYAIGNPIGFEFQRSVTGGIISALDRTVKITDEKTESYMEDLIQTDATINPGNSGGPLINLNGEVVGINSVKITSAEGIGFAVPINIVKPIIEKLVNNQTLEEAYLGIYGFDENVIPYLNGEIEFSGGVYVAQINLDGPTRNSGIQVGDIITKIDNTTVNKMSDLREYIYSKNPDDTVSITLIRNNKSYVVNIKLARKV